MSITISKTTYQELIRHLEINAETDADAQILLEKLRKEGKPSYHLESGSFIIDGNAQKPTYSV